MLNATRRSARQDACRDPEVSAAYAKDPLCTQRGTFRGVADMLLGVSPLH